MKAHKAEGCEGFIYLSVNQDLNKGKDATLGIVDHFDGTRLCVIERDNLRGSPNEWHGGPDEFPALAYIRQMLSDAADLLGDKLGDRESPYLGPLRELANLTDRKWWQRVHTVRILRVKNGWSRMARVARRRGAIVCF